MRRMLLPMVITLAFAGCYTEADVGGSYSYGYAAATPSLYYVSPGVQVVAYSDDPVFYSDGYYWRYDGGIWYRSGYYNSGWVVYNNVPYGVRSIHEPYRYARFTPGQGWSRGGTATYQGGVDVRDHRGGYAPRDQRSGPVYQAPPPAARDHRSAPVYQAPPPAARPAPGPGPDVRDHRRGR